MPTVAIRQVQIESVVAVIDNGRGAGDLDYIMPPAHQWSQEDSIRSDQGQFLVSGVERGLPGDKCETAPTSINERLSCDHKTAFSLVPVEPPQGMVHTEPQDKGIQINQPACS